MALLMARVLVAVWQFARLSRWLGGAGAVSRTLPTPTVHTALHTQDVTRAIATLSRYFRCTCLVQAVAGKIMLERRGISHALVLGVRKDGDTQLQAHAWLQCGDRIVLGGRQAPHFTAVTMFASLAAENLS